MFDCLFLFLHFYFLFSKILWRGIVIFNNYKTIIEFIEDKILIEKWSPEEIAGYIKVNDMKFDIQPSFQTIYYWLNSD